MWAWILGGLVVWVVVALVLGVLIGRSVRLADARSPGTGAVLTTADLPAGMTSTTLRAPRRRVPLPPVGVGLAATAVVLETVGYLARLAGATGPAARLLSMDAPGSLPRTYVAALFGAAAVAAVAGAARIPGRRTWWLAVGLVAAGIAVVKAGSTVHVRAVAGLGDAVGPAGAVVVSVLLAAAVLAALAVVSRAERRDRRRVLGGLAGYAVAAVGLSAVSAAVGGRWGTTVTYLEESGEALAGVAVLIAVLVGVAPRLVLPADWPLRRRSDADALEVPDRVARPAVD